MRPRRRPRAPARARAFVAPAFRLSALQRVRIFLVGAVAVAGAAWALARHLGRTPAQMVVEPPPATEIPAPDLEPSP